jgi:hypothetical protein
MALRNSAARHPKTSLTFPLLEGARWPRRSTTYPNPEGYSCPNIAATAMVISTRIPATTITMAIMGHMGTTAITVTVTRWDRVEQ